MVESKSNKGSKKETVMILCAHPDDEILGVGGTIARYSREGKHVICVIFSYGETSHWWLQKKHTVEMRVKESRAASEIVGTEKTIFLGLKDFDLKNEMKRKKNIVLLEKVIREHSPDKIFTHSPEDIIYADHRAVWNSVDKVTKKMGYKGDIYVFNIWGQDVKLSNNPKLLVGTKDTFRMKVRALRCFRSQMLYLLQLIPGVIWRDFKTGIENKTRFAESFIKIK